MKKSSSLEKRLRIPAIGSIALGLIIETIGIVSAFDDFVLKKTRVLGHSGGRIASVNEMIRGDTALISGGIVIISVGVVLILFGFKNNKS